MKSVRESFIRKFGKEEAEKIEKAAQEHENGVNNGNKGRDPFKWAILICLGYECISKDGYRDYHGITTPWPELKKWIKRSAKLHTHDGDCDYLSLFAGVYNEYMPKGE